MPDLYQGTESEYLALVDPDNRRPFRRPEGPEEEKQVVTAAALRLRRELPEVFGELGTYVPLSARGPAAGHVVAFSRSGEVAVAVTRLSLRLAEDGGWRDTVVELPDGGRGGTCWPPGPYGSGRGRGGGGRAVRGAAGGAVAEGTGVTPGAVSLRLEGFRRGGRAGSSAPG